MLPRVLYKKAEATEVEKEEEEEESMHFKTLAFARKCRRRNASGEQVEHKQLGLPDRGKAARVRAPF